MLQLKEALTEISAAAGTGGVTTTTREHRPNTVRTPRWHGAPPTTSACQLAANRKRPRLVLFYTPVTTTGE